MEIQDDEEDFVVNNIYSLNNGIDNGPVCNQNCGSNNSPTSLSPASENTSNLRNRPLVHSGNSIRTQQRKRQYLSIAADGCKSISSFFIPKNSNNTNEIKEQEHVEEITVLSLEESVELINQLPFLQNKKRRLLG